MRRFCGKKTPRRRARAQTFELRRERDRRIAHVTVVAGAEGDERAAIADN